MLAFFAMGAKLYKNKIFLALITIFLLINMRLYFNLADLKTKSYHPLTKIKYLDAINERFSQGYVFIVYGFGHYFIKQIYGPKDQCVVYLDRGSRDSQIVGIKEVLKQLDRKALFICGDISPFLREHFPDLVEHKFDFYTHGWRVWYQP